MAQLVKRSASAQVMISQLVGLSPTLGSVLTAQNLDPASDSVSPSLSLPLPAHILSLSLSKINKHLKNVIKTKKQTSCKNALRQGETKNLNEGRSRLSYCVLNRS